MCLSRTSFFTGLPLGIPAVLLLNLSAVQSLPADAQGFALRADPHARFKVFVDLCHSIGL